MKKLIFLLYINKTFIQEPNPEDPLNKEAAEVLQNNKRQFEQNVYKSMLCTIIERL